MKCRWVGFLLLSGGIVAAIAGCGGHEAEATPKVAAAPKAVTVTVAPLEHRAVIRTVDVVGTLHGWEDVTIGAKREGRVRKVLHDMGDRVEPGDVARRAREPRTPTSRSSRPSTSSWPSWPSSGSRTCPRGISTSRPSPRSSRRK